MKNKLINKLTKQILALLISISIAFNPVVLPLAHAEGESTPSAQSVEVTPTPTETPAPTPAATLDTGDAGSTSTAQTEVNTNKDEIPGTVTPGSCGPEITTECPGPGITNDNTADTSGNNESSAQTGDNSSTGALGSVDLTTGDATASADTSNQINTNIIEIATPSASLVDPEATPSAEVESTPTPTPFLISNTNEATVENNQTVDAGTGGNTANQNAGDVNLETGSSLAIGNIFNLINTNIVGSNFEILLLNLTGQSGDINLNQTWEELLANNPQEALILAGEPNPNNLQVMVQNDNTAEVNNNLTVNSTSGQNKANENSGAVNLETDNATALANLTNVVNVNITGSKFLFTIVNIMDSFKGNIILPRPEYFAGADSQTEQIQTVSQNDNLAEVEGNVLADALSGENKQEGNASGSALQTGAATASSHNLSFLNLNITRNRWFNLMVNNLGNRLGRVFGWSNPESAEDVTSDTSTYSTGSADLGSPDLTSQGSPDQTTTIENHNRVKIRNNVLAKANSGQNEASGNLGPVNTKTGDALALANIFNLANLNISGSLWFFGAINVLGDWDGNTFFAYPDTTVSLNGPNFDVKPGEEANYTVSLKNVGFDDAPDVKLTVTLPKGMSYLSNTLGSQPEISGRTLTWVLDTMPAESKADFLLTVKIDPSLSPKDMLSFWDKIVTPAYAAEDGIRQKLTVNASVSTSDTQSNTNNDSTSTNTTIYFPSTSNNQNNTSQNNQSAPKLELSAKNNAGAFIYPGGTIHFELEVKNTGNAIAKNIKITQDVYDGVPESLGTDEFEIGDLEVGKSANISFDVMLTQDMPIHIYTTKAYAKGQKPNGEEVSSNEAQTKFEVKNKPQSQPLSQNPFIPEVLAAENNNQGKPTADFNTSTFKWRDWIPYAVMVGLGLLWLYEYSRRKSAENKLKTLLKKNPAQKAAE